MNAVDEGILAGVFTLIAAVGAAILVPIALLVDSPGPKLLGLVILTAVFTGPALGIALHLWINTAYIVVRNTRRNRRPLPVK